MSPDYAPDNLHVQIALAKLERGLELIVFWDRKTPDQQTGKRYYRRINVEASCHAANADT